MKRVISVLLALLLMVGLLPMAAFAEEAAQFTFSVDPADKTQFAIGDKFKVTLTLSGNTGFGAMTLKLKWNDQAVKFAGFDTVYDEDLEEDVLDSDVLLPAYSPTVNQEAATVVCTRTKNITKNGKVFTANFEVIGEGNLEIGLKDGTDFEYIDQSLVTISNEIKTDALANLTAAAAPAVTYGISVNASEKGTVTADKVIAAEGETVTLTVTPATGFMLDTLTVMNGETPVEVTNNTFEMPAAAVTVSATFKVIPTGYNVTMGEDKTVDVGENIQIPVTVGYSAAENETAPTTYKSYELTFQYDTNMLTLVTGSSDDEAQEFTVVDEDGTVIIRRYGNEKNVGEAAVTLEFTANKTGESDVKLTSAKIGTSDDAQDEDIPVAAIIDDLTKITVTGYDVDLDEAFTGAGVADPEKDYTFDAKDKNYIYTVTVTVGDETFEISDKDQDGTLIIPKDKITGNMKIVVQSAVGKTFNVKITGDGAAAVTGEGEAQYMTDYVLSAAEGVNLTGYTIKYKIGDGEEKTMSNNTIPGGEITGNITITVTAPGTTPEDPDRPENSWKITFEGNGKNDVQTNSNYVTKGQPYTFQINKTEGYTYIVTYTGADGVVELTAAEDGTYTITPTADMIIKVMKWNVEVNQYVALNGKTVFMVSVSEAENVGMKYDGNTMFVKSVKALGDNDKYTGEAADKYVYLVEVNAGESLDVVTAAKKLSIVENVTCKKIEKTFNVNGSTNLDINDAQLVYDMYNNVYQDITTVSMEKFLCADIGGDRVIDVQDAIAVVTAILTPQA